MRCPVVVLSAWVSSQYRGAALTSRRLKRPSMMQSKRLKKHFIEEELKHNELNESARKE
jgi:hypothetical protein